MVLATESPNGRLGSESTVSFNRSVESYRSGYILPQGRDPDQSWVSNFFCEYILCGCLCRDHAVKENRLTIEEENFLEEYRTQLEESFDSQNPDHEMLLSNIWRNTFPGTPIPGFVDNRWTQLGFQSANPRTDIRTGVHSLRSIEYMSRIYPVDFQRIVHESSLPESEYPFAASCVSVAFSILIFFRLNRRTSVNPSGTASGNALALKQFVRLSMSDINTCHEIFCYVTIRVHSEWMRQRIGQFDIHYFATALSEGVGSMQEMFNKKRIKNLEDLKEI